MSVSDFPVFRNPSQLLRFLGLSGPDAPNRLADLIQGTVDLLPWWTLANETNVTYSVSVAAGVIGLQTTGAPVVPARTRWLVSQLGIQFVGGAAITNLRVAGVISNPATTERYQVGPTSTTWVNGTSEMLDCLGPRPSFAFLNEGDQLLINVPDNISTVAVTLRLNAKVLQFQV